MKKLLLSLVLFVFSGTLFAAENYGVVDMQKINQEASVYKNLQTQVQQKQSSFELKIKNTDEELRTEEKKLADSRETLSPQEFENRRKALVAKIDTERKNIQSEKQKIEVAISNAAMEVGKKLEESIADVAKSKNLSIVYVKNSLAYHKPESDITKEVINILNKKISRVQIK